VCLHARGTNLSMGQTTGAAGKLATKDSECRPPLGPAVCLCKQIQLQLHKVTTVHHDLSSLLYITTYKHTQQH